MQEYSDYDTDRVKSNSRKIDTKPKKSEKKPSTG